MPSRRAPFALLALSACITFAAAQQDWNRILTSPTPSFNTRPNEFLVEIARQRKPGKALDIGMGQGRNAIWLAQQGWDVTGFDPAGDAVALAQKTAAAMGLKLDAQVTSMENFDFGRDRWDLILLSYVPPHPVARQLERALRPGGVLVVEGFHREAARMMRIGPGVVFDSQELPKLFRELEVVRYEEPVRRPDFGAREVRIVRYCGRRPE